ncbi:MAG: hypothetical protein HFJ27_01150 [Clostridia bacterium]|nr:hypothetical protein [Clostridia bacterium]
MANETKVGELSINLKMRLEGLEKGIETAKKKLQEIEKSSEQVKNSNKNLEGSYLAMSAVAVASLMKISGVIKDCVNEYNSYTQAMSSLQNVSEYTGESMQDLSKIMDKFGSYMTKSDLATTIKNFSLMGMTAEQTEQMIEALTNSAIRNRNANYTVSEAVRVASEGYRQGLSTLSDSAGVTENLSVQLDVYAKSIGKTASQLTEAEKNQAYLNRTMYAAEPFANAMSDYMDTLAGKQGQYSQAIRETQVAYAEALEPMLLEMTELKTGLVKILGNLIGNNKAATAGITTFVATAMTAIVAIVGLTTAKTAYAKATGVATLSTKAFTAALLTNPITGIVVALSAFVSVLTMATTAAKEQAQAQANLTEETERYNKIVSGTYGYTEKEISEAEQAKARIEEQIDLLKKQIDKQNEINKLKEDQKKYASYGKEEQEKDSEYKNYYEMAKNIKIAEEQLKNLKDTYKEATKDGKKMGDSIDELKQKLEPYNKQLEKSNVVKNIKKALDVETIKKQQQEAAQLKINADTMQDYLNIIKTGKKNTTEYQEAVKTLSERYPEAANAEGILIAQAQGFIDAEKLKASEAWKGSQDTINSYIEMLNTALESESVQRQVAQNIGIAYENIRPALISVLGVLQAMAGYQATDVPNIKPTSLSRKKSSSSSKTYQNKALDNYKKQIEYKKSLDQISLRDEINMYETALKRYAKTTDEKRELREKIYELNKELANKEKELLDQQTEDYEAYIQQQKSLRGSAYDVTKQTSDYNKIIQMHKNYLSQIMKDERLSLDERKAIYREELQIIRDYEQQKRDLRVEQIDNTVSHLTNAITKQLEEMQEKDKEFIDKQIEGIEKLKEVRINAINSEYDTKIEAIEKELAALDKAEQQKTRDEEDAEHEKKKKRLEELIAFEHDAVTKANYQKELDKLLAEYQKTLNSRALEDKKEALNAQKDLLQEEQDNKVQTIEEETEKQKEAYNKQLENLEKYYDEQINMAQKTAQNMLLNVEQNQQQILNLLNKYGDKYEITGQTLGEKLAQGINEGLASKIESIIARIQNTIDAKIEAEISKMASSVYRYESGINKPQAKTIQTNVTQNNYIQQNPEMPSETYRKLNNVSRNLAAELAGV